MLPAASDRAGARPGLSKDGPLGRDARRDGVDDGSRADVPRRRRPEFLLGEGATRA
jgi:hypothetical protein